MGTKQVKFASLVVLGFGLLALPYAWTAAPAPKPEEPWGDLKGKFVFDGKPPATKHHDLTKVFVPLAYRGRTIEDETLLVAKDGGIANVIVFLRDEKAKVHPDYEKTAKDKPVLRFKEGRFDPHVLSVREGQTVVLETVDPDPTNFHFQGERDDAFNVLVRGGDKHEQRFTRSTRIPGRVNSSIYSWASGWILVRPTPYVAVSGRDGSFSIKNLPVGEWEFQVWHEQVGWVRTPEWKEARFKVTIKPGVVDLGAIKVKVAPDRKEEK